MDIVVKIENVTKVYGNQTVLNNVSLICEKGNIYGLVGRNGSGKTVLLKCICGLIHPTSGVVHVWGKQIGKDALSNLKHLALIRGNTRITEIIESLKTVGLDPFLKKPVGKYSMGMRQRLGIAQAIMEKPHLLILDEPMNGLDNHGVEDIRSVLLLLKESGVTIILASHFKEDISYLCDEVYQIDAGILTCKHRKSS